MPSHLAATLTAATVTGFMAVVACEPVAPPSGRQLLGAPAQATALDISRCASSNTGFSNNFTNPFFLQGAGGHQLVLEAQEGGDRVRIVMTLLTVTRNVGGVITRVLEEREFLNGTLTEVTWNYHAQASDGTVCYFGEDVDVYENGTITHGGAWCGVGLNQPGIFVPVNPRVGQEFQMEVAPGVALDEGRIVGSGTVKVPFGTFTNTVRIREFNPLDGGKDFKVLASGVGFIVDGAQQLTEINQTSGAPPQPTLTLIACGTP